MTALLERPHPVPEALIEEARGRQRQRRALIGVLVLLVGAVLALPVIASDGSGSSAERFGDRFGPLHQGLTMASGPSPHTATSVLYVDPGPIDVDPRASRINAAYRRGIRNPAATLREMTTSRHSVRAAIARSGVDRLPAEVARLTRAERGSTFNLIEVSVTDRTKQTALRLTNALAEVAVEQINQVAPPLTGEAIVSIYERARETS